MYRHQNDIQSTDHFMITATMNYGMYTYTSYNVKRGWLLPLKSNPHHRM